MKERIFTGYMVLTEYTTWAIVRNRYREIMCQGSLRACERWLNEHGYRELTDTAS